MITANSNATLLDQLLDSITLGEQHRTDNRMLLAAKIADAMQEKKISQIQLAQMLGKHHSVITKWLSGTNNFTIDTISDIERALGVNLIQLIDNQTITIKFYLVSHPESLNNDNSLPLSYDSPVLPHHITDSEATSKVHFSMYNSSHKRPQVTC